jgi:hypothetical protein
MIGHYGMLLDIFACPKFSKQAKICLHTPQTKHPPYLPTKFLAFIAET